MHISSIQDYKSLVPGQGCILNVPKKKPKLTSVLSLSSPCSAFDYDTENMNSEDIYSSLKGVTEAIQNFSVRSQEDMNEPVQRREGEEVSGAKRPRLSGTESGSVPLGTTCLQTRAGHHRFSFFL